MNRRYATIAASLIAFLAQAAAADDARGRVTEPRVLAEAAKGENWFLSGGGFDGAHFSPLSAIDTGTVSRLGLAWWRNLPVVDGIAATPIVVDGVIYLSAPYSEIFAIDAGNGRVLWQHDPDVRAALVDDPYMSWIARSNRGVAVWDGLVIVATADCRLVAVDAADGSRAWSAKTCDPAMGYGITDAPHVGGGKVFIGNAGSESGERNRGYVSAYDAKTGKFLWRFHTVPSPNEEENDTPAMRMAAATWTGDSWQAFGGGGSAWNGMTYDPESNRLYFGTAGALPYLHHQRSPDGGDNLFLSSVLALDADTGEYVWHYQTVPEDSWEYNATMNIVLADLDVDGESRKALLIAPKNGFFYALDRNTGELLTAGKYARVNWAEGINPETGRPIVTPEARFWELPEGETMALWPNMWGAHSWNPMAWHPGLGLAYVPVVDVPSVVTHLGDGDYGDTLELVEEVDGEAHSPGKLVAFDPARQSVRWQADQPLPFNGGVLATAGGLVFQGDAMGDFTARDAATGRALWSMATGSPINSAPVSFVLGGRQYVLVAAGSGGGAQFIYPQMHAGEGVTGPTRLLAFALDGEERLPPIVPVKRVPEVATPSADAAVIARGRDLYAESCGSCHGKNAIARHGGSVPDLRFASAASHSTWQSIVIGGARRALGMPGFEISPEDAEAIRQYILAEAQATVKAR
jgi:quinohemoprotein ethanol dehydrogenase